MDGLPTMIVYKNIIEGKVCGNGEGDVLVSCCPQRPRRAAWLI